MPNIIVSSGYIKNTEHYLNYLTYSGEKLEAQTLVFKDGTTVDVNPDEKIDASAIEDLEAVKIELKDGTSRYLTPARYQKFTREKEDGYVEHTLVLEDGTEQALTPEIYLKYMGERPSVEKDDDFGHGLFDMDGIVDMQKERQRVIENDGSVKWSHIVSLSREDAERTSFDNRQAWQNLIRAKAYDLARIYNISPENLVINAAYHDKAHHPHIHLFFYSTDNREGTFAGKDALINKTEKMKSLFNNTIFSGDTAFLKEEKQEYKKAFQNEMEQITKAIGRKGYEPHPKIEEAFSDLSDSLIDYTGRPYYQYLQPEVKLQVQDVLKKCVELDPNLNKIFSRTCDNQKAFIAMYADDEEKINKRLESFKEHFFTPDGKNDSRTLHNIIIKNAMLYNQQRAPGARVVRKKEPSSFSNELILPDDLEKNFTLETIVDRKNETLPFSNETTLPDSKANSVSATGVVRKKEYHYKRKDGKKVPDNHLELYRLGKLHLADEDVPKDIDKAIFYLEASADQDNQFAQYQLGKLYLEGIDVQKDVPMALEYLNKSASQGNQFAQYALGMAYYKGVDIPKNKLLAKEYFGMAASQGNDSAKTMLKVMKSQELRPAYAACHMLFQLGNTMARQTNQNLSPDINQKDKDKDKNPPRFKTRRHTKKKFQSISIGNPMEY